MPDAFEVNTERETTLFEIATEVYFPPANLKKKERNTDPESLKQIHFHCTRFTFNRFNPSVPHLAAERGTEQSTLCSAPG